MANNDILTKDKNGEVIPLDDPDYPVLLKIIHKAIRTTSKLNNLVIDDLSEINRIFSELIGRQVDETFFMIPPFIRISGRTSVSVKTCSLIMAALLWIVVALPWKITC